MRESAVAGADGNPVRQHAHSDESTYWDIRDIQFHCRISRSTAWRLVRTPGFPAPTVIASKALRWRRDDVEAFLDSRRDPQRYSDASGDRPAGPASAAYVVRTVRTR